MKAVIYARYSSDNQREENIEAQLRECMEFDEWTGVTLKVLTVRYQLIRIITLLFSG